MIACTKCRCCEAYVDRNGEKWDWCIWCQDGVVCPGAQRRAREAKLPPLRKPLKEVVRRGCRCDECRAANTKYEKDRAVARKAGDWNGLVPATRARNHVKRLSKAGVGYKQVAKVGGVGKTAIAAILSGKKKRIRARTSRRILAVKPNSHAAGALVPAETTWIMIRKLTKRGMLKGDIALQLGNARPALQLRKGFVQARTAEKVAAIYAETVRPGGRAYA